MLDQRLRQATDATKSALSDSTPPPIDELIALPQWRGEQSELTGWRGPLIAVGAAAAVIIVVTIGVLLLRGLESSIPPADTVPATTTTLPQTTVTTEPALLPTDLFEDATWQQVAVDEPWASSVIDLDALSGGGFVVVTAEPSPWSVAWSPNGVDWNEGDPNGVLSGLRGEWGTPFGLSDGRGPDLDRALIADDRVVVLAEDGPTVWIGDPRTSQWQGVPLDTAGILGDPSPRAMAANATEVLVVGQDRTANEIVAWLVDPDTATSQRTTGPAVEAGLADHITPEIGATWLQGQWIIITDLMAPEGYTDSYGSETASRSVMWASEDATTWTEVALPEDPAGMLAHGDTGLFVSTGPMAADIWYTPDLITWTHIVDEGVSLTDERELGFVVPTPAEAGYVGVVDVDPSGPGSFWVAVSSDGRTWEPKVSLPPGLLSNNAESYSDGKLLAGLVRPGSGTELWLLIEDT
jgi:hypothetical protein